MLDELMCVWQGLCPLPRHGGINESTNKQAIFIWSGFVRTDSSWSRPFRDFLSGDSCKVTSQTKKKNRPFLLHLDLKWTRRVSFKCTLNVASRKGIFMIFLQKLKIRVVNTWTPFPLLISIQYVFICPWIKRVLILKLHLREDWICNKLRCFPRTSSKKCCHPTVQHRANVLHLVPCSDSLWCNWHQVQSNRPDCRKPVKPVGTVFNCRWSIFYNLWIKSPSLGGRVNCAACQGNARVSGADYRAICHPGQQPGWSTAIDLQQRGLAIPTWGWFLTWR